MRVDFFQEISWIFLFRTLKLRNVTICTSAKCCWIAPFKRNEKFSFWVFWSQLIRRNLRSQKNQWFTQNNSKTINYQEHHKICANTRIISEFNYILILPPWILLNYSFRWLFRVDDCRLLYRGFISGGGKDMNFMLEWQKHHLTRSICILHWNFRCLTFWEGKLFSSQSINTDMRSRDIPTCNTKHVFLIFGLFPPFSQSTITYSSWSLRE